MLRKTHCCFIVGCISQISGSQIMCDEHYDYLPQTTRHELGDLRRRAVRGEDGCGRKYAEAIGSAVKTVQSALAHVRYPPDEEGNECDYEVAP